MLLAVVHAGKLGNVEVLATNEHVSYYPPPRMGADLQDPFLSFGIEWNEGTSHRNNFLVLIPEKDGRSDYELVFEGKDLETACVGIRAYVDGRPDPDGKILWAQQGIESRYWVY